MPISWLKLSIFFIFFLCGQSGETCRWRVCYRRGYPSNFLTVGTLVEKYFFYLSCFQQCLGKVTCSNAPSFGIFILKRSLPFINWSGLVISFRKSCQKTLDVRVKKGLGVALTRSGEPKYIKNLKEGLLRTIFLRGMFTYKLGLFLFRKMVFVVSLTELLRPLKESSL